jgi:hypothetical protein
MTRLLAPLGGLLLFLAPACASKEPPGTVEKGLNRYQNTFDFVWESALEELRSSWTVERADRARREITTAWVNNMAPFAGKGTRDRLVVTFSGDDRSGWQPDVRQQSQTNDNEEEPLNVEKAKWKDSSNDGGLAAKFLRNLDTRLQPDERWRDREAR